MTEADRQYTKSYAARNSKKISVYQSQWRDNNLESNTMDAARALQASDGTKVCGQCHVPKLYAEFNLCRATKDGLYGWCKACQSVYKKRLWQRKHAAK